MVELVAVCVSDRKRGREIDAERIEQCLSSAFDVPREEDVFKISQVFTKKSVVPSSSVIKKVAGTVLQKVRDVLFLKDCKATKTSPTQTRCNQDIRDLFARSSARNLTADDDSDDESEQITSTRQNHQVVQTDADGQEEKINNAIERLLCDICAVLDRQLPPIKGDRCIQIGTTVTVVGVLGIAYKHIVALDSCDKLEGIDVEWYKTEEQVLLAWTRFMQKLDPDILCGKRPMNLLVSSLDNILNVRSVVR